MSILKTYAINFLNLVYWTIPFGHRGNVFIEYIVLAMLVLAAAIWFYNGGDFQGVRQNVDATFTNLINQVAQ